MQKQSCLREGTLQFYPNHSSEKLCTRPVKILTRPLLRNTKILDLAEKRMVSAAKFSFWSKAKMSQIAPNIFQTFYQISSRLSLTFQHIKNLDDTFFILGSYCPFWLLTWSKIYKIDFFIILKSNSFQKKSVWLLKLGSKFLIFDHVKSLNM